MSNFSPKKFVLVDNGLLNHLCRKENETAIERWFAELFKRGITHPEPAAFVATPFMLLEAIGITVPTPSQSEIALSFQGTRDVEVMKLRVYEAAYKFFANHRSLSVKRIRAAAEEKRNNCSPLGRQLFDDVVGHKVERRGFQNTLYQMLAMDFVYRYQGYPGRSTRHVHASFMIDIFRATDGEWDLSQARVIKEAWLQMRPIVVRERIFPKFVLNRIHKSLCMDNSADLLDTEVIHYAVIGKAENGGLWPVYCFTCDKPAVIKDRIAMFRECLKIIVDFLASLDADDAKRVPFDIRELKNGLLYVCSHRGRVKMEIDPSRIRSLSDRNIPDRLNVVRRRVLRFLWDGCYKPVQSQVRKVRGRFLARLNSKKK